MDSNDDDPRLPELVSKATEALEHGEEPDVAQICSGCPELVPAVEQALEFARRLPALQRGAASSDGFVGRTLAARYLLVDRLGSGAMGVVYKAEDLELRRFVAVKILRMAAFEVEGAESRFERESEALAAIDHSAVVTVHDRGTTEDGEPFLVMELLDGVSLSELIEHAPALDRDGGDDPSWLEQFLNPESVSERSYLRIVVGWVRDLALGLEASHAAGVLHRDVKPSNVFVRADGRAVLLDFGIASFAERESLTLAGSPLGTPAYMAPESLTPKREPSPRLDVYGLTATLYHLLTHRAPFLGSPTQILSALATRSPAPAARLRPGLPRDLQAILDKGMSPRPAERYASAGAMAGDLQAFLEYRPVKARPLGVVARAWRQVRRSNAARAAIAVGALALLAGAGLAWNARRERARALEYERIERQLPPNFAIVGFDNRATTQGGERERLFGLLDRAVEVATDPVPSRLLRAAARLDHGNPRGAAEDMAFLAERIGSPYVRGLAERYAALAPDADTAAAVDQEALPEPTEPLDVYIAAFHRARDLAYVDASAMLRDAPSLDGYLPAVELLVTTMAGEFKQLSPGEIEARAYEMLKRTRELEEERGYRTATTAQCATAAFIRLKRFEDAFRAAKSGLELAPDSHVLSSNAGLAAWRTARIPEAVSMCEAAIHLRPRFYPPYYSLIHALLWRQDFEGSLGFVERAPMPEGPVGEARRTRLVATVESNEATHLWSEGEYEAARSLAKSSNAKLESIGDLRRNPLPAEAVINRAILDRDPSQAFFRARTSRGCRTVQLQAARTGALVDACRADSQ